MPCIVIKDYTWRQTSEFVIVNVPIRGHPRKVNLFVIANYLKVSFPPFMLEVFLWANVVERESKCVITDEEAILNLRKANVDVEWPVLEMQDIDNQFKQECRNRAIEEAQKVAQDDKKRKQEKRQYLQKEAVKAQMEINAATLNEIDAIRNAHRKEAMQEFEDWRSKAELPFLPGIRGETQENRKAYKQPLKWFKDENNALKSRPMTEEEIFRNNYPSKVTESTIKEYEEEKCSNNDSKPKASNSGCSEDSDSDDEKDRPGLKSVKAAINGYFRKRNSIFDDPSKSMPLPRKNAVITVTFSERQFPTPARESYRPEEEEWLRKQAEARRKIGFDSKDLRPEERDPVWLKDKGDEFFKVGNYLGAISAYSYGIQISDKMASLYVNRSAAHYALGNYFKCTEDCSKALELMVPECESNRESRARCHARRGAALCKLSAPQHGIPELEAALKLTPDNDSIKRDLLTAKRYFDIKD